MHRRDILRSLLFRPSTAKSLININVPDSSTIQKIHPENTNSFKSKWHLLPDTASPGEDFCAQGMQDWCIKNGELNCVTHGAYRILDILTHQLSDGNNSFKVTFIFRFLNQPCLQDDIENFAGFRLGIKVRMKDNPPASLKNKGIDAGVTGNGYLFIGKTFSEKKIDEIILTDKIRLQFSVIPISTGGNFAKLKAFDISGNTIATLSSAQYDAGAWEGNIALVSHFKSNQENKDRPTIAINKFEIEGEKITLCLKDNFTSIMLP